MSELTVCFCDFCNTTKSLHPRDGRGFSEWSEEHSIAELGWKRTSDGKIMCVECQDEQEEKTW